MGGRVYTPPEESTDVPNTKEAEVATPAVSEEATEVHATPVAELAKEAE